MLSITQTPMNTTSRNKMSFGEISPREFYKLKPGDVVKKYTKSDDQTTDITDEALILKKTNQKVTILRTDINSRSNANLLGLHVYIQAALLKKELDTGSFLANYSVPGTPKRIDITD